MSDNRVVKATPLAEGDPAWVFPEGSVTQALVASLAESSDRLVEIAGLLVGSRVGWAGSGLEYNLFPSGKCCLHGRAENSQVTFEAELAPPGFAGTGAVGWDVTADINVRCDAKFDASCGMHVVEEFMPNVYATPEDAIAALLKATDWLLGRCRAVPPEDWRARDPLEPCRGYSKDVE